MVLPLGAQAAPIDAFKLEATPGDPTLVSDFSLTFDDLDGDMLFSMNELTTFSGVEFIFSSRFYDTLSSAPVIAGISDSTGNVWSFNGGSGTGTSDNWTYNITAVAAVPLPASSLLLLGGLGGLLAMRRRKSF
jgi:hypothetical protein